jgi:hypothetical protein
MAKSKKVKAGTRPARAATKTKPHVDYSPELWERICDLIAIGKPVAQIAKMASMPHRTTILKWAGEDGKADSYARAREAQASHFAAEIIEIVDAPVLATGDAAKTEMSRRQMQMDARKWLAARLAPKQFGDKLDVLNRQANADGSNLPAVPPAPLVVHFTTQAQDALPQPT